MGVLKSPLTVSLLALALTACGHETADTRAKPAAAVPVTVVEVAPAEWTDVIEAVGTAQANESVTLTAKIAETVRKVNFSDGQRVDAGDILVEMTSNQQVAQLEDTQAMYKDAQRQYERQQDLVKQGTVSKAQFDTTQATRDSTLAKVNAIRAQLADRVITAPFAGVLGLRRVSPGTLVTPGTPITTLDDVHVIKLDFAVPETLMAALKPGLMVRAKSVAYPERAFEGQVESLDSRVDPATRAITVRALVPNSEGLLRPGMLLGVEVRARTRNALALPELALVPIGSKQFAYRVGPDDVAHRVELKLGTRRDGAVEVVEGLSAGDRVVVEGTVLLRDGAKVGVVAPTAVAEPKRRQASEEHIRSNEWTRRRGDAKGAE
jgi:membrane fusion protein (multidrug efflux system)